VRSAEQQQQQQQHFSASTSSSAGQRKRNSSSSLNGSSRSGVAAAADARLAEVVRLYEAGKDKAAAENDALRREVAALAEELRRVEVSASTHHNVYTAHSACFIADPSCMSLLA
jgi:hypothetical protein